MRNFSIKKLAVVATGAALVGTALAPIVAADMPTKSDLVASDGSMNVDIVVGSKAKASDVVWAGNIAAVLAQKAYVEKDVVTGGGECVGATPSIEGLKATVTVGGTVSVTGGKTFFSYMYSGSGGSGQQEGAFQSQQVSESNIAGLKYYGNKSYLWNGTSYTTTMQERLAFTADVFFDPITKLELVAEVASGGLVYNVNLGSGIPKYENTSVTTKFQDDANDNVRIPFFGADYLVKQVDAVSNLIELIKGSAEKSYSEGDKLTGLVGKNGENFYIVVGSGGTVGSTQKVTMTLYSEDGTQITSDDFGAEDVIFYWPDDYADAGEVILQTLVTITEIKKTVVADAEIYYPTILTGTDRIQVYDSKGYPYDSTLPSDEYDWEVRLNFDGNYLKDINVQNTSRNAYVGVDALPVGEESMFPNDVGSITFLGLQLPEFSTYGVSKTERVTTVEIKDETLYYKDNTYEAQHELPFFVYNQLSDTGSVTNTIDTKDIWYKLNIGDVNVAASASATGASPSAHNSANTCIGDGNYINGQEVDLTTFTDATSVVVNGTSTAIGARVDINGMQFRLDAVDGTNNCAYFAADGNVTFKKSSSTGELIQEWWYVDKNVSKSGVKQAYVTLEGASGVTNQYLPMVDEISATTGRLWLLMNAQSFTTQYSKKVALVGVDDDESSILAGQGDANFYVPHSSYMPGVWQSTASGNLGTEASTTPFDSQYYIIAKFKIDEDEAGSPAHTGEAGWDMNLFVDTTYGVGEAITLPNTNLSGYSYEADYNYGSKYISESTTTTYPSEVYTDWGSHITLSDHEYKIVMPENRPQAEILVSGTGTSTDTTGGETSEALGEGETFTTSGGTIVTIDSLSYDSAVCTGEGGEVACDPTPSTYKSMKAVSTPFVVFDTDAGNVLNHIIIGGWKVNTFAKGLGLEEKLTSSGDYVVEVTADGDVAVAGYKAADTGTAARALIDEIETW